MKDRTDVMRDGQAMRRRERGASLVEMALVLPLLVLLTGSIVDLGWTFRSYVAMMNASREGARTGARLPCYSDNAAQREALKAAIQDAVMAEVTYLLGEDPLITCERSKIEITPDLVLGCAAPGGELRVTVECTRRTFLGRLVGLDTPLRIRASTAMAAFGKD